MDISLTDDQVAVADSVKDLLVNAWPREKMRAYCEGGSDGDDASLWRALARSEFHKILTPEAHGGAGASIRDLVPVLEQVGYALAPTRFATSAVLGTYILSRVEQNPSVVAILGEGRRLAVALSEAISYAQVDGELCLTGAVGYVPDVRGAEHLLILTPDIVALVDLPHEQVLINDVELVDATRRVGTLTFQDAVVASDAQLMATGGIADLWARAGQLKLLITVCDCLGGAGRALDMAVQYSGERYQFGRPIGSFQSLQHLMADAYVSLENLRSAAWYAAFAFDNQADDIDFAVLAASILASKTYLQIADLNIQVHGGMGFTTEVDAYLYAARAKVNEVQDGTLGSRIGQVTAWLQTADLGPLVDYLGGQRLQLSNSMFGPASAR